MKEGIGELAHRKKRTMLRMQEIPSRSNTFGRHIRKLRKEKYLTLYDVAAQCYISAGYLSKVEIEEYDPPSDTVIGLLADALGTDENELHRLAGKVPVGLKAMMVNNPLLVELVRVLSERVLPDEVYRQLIERAQQATQC